MDSFLVINKKQVRKKLFQDEREISKILLDANSNLMPIDKVKRIEMLVEETGRLRSILYSRSLAQVNERNPNEKVLQEMNSELFGWKSVCPSCGAPNENNTMNGRLWCCRCKNFFDSPQKVKRKLPQGVSQEEYEEFEKLKVVM